ncbi:MAG: hypothetical protein ACRD1H_15995, partial [Vicinamibacterales bacterium]
MRSTTRFAGVPEYDWRCLRLQISGGEPALLVEGGSPERIFNPTWSPDGATMLLPVTRAFPLATDNRRDWTTNQTATDLLVFDSSWRPGMTPRVIYNSGRDLHGWLPVGALDSAQSLATTGSDQRGLETSVDNVTITPGSEAGRSGDYLIAGERGSDLPVIWGVEEDIQRRLAHDATDLSWFNHGRTVIGVSSDPIDPFASRIVLYSASISNAAAYLDHRQFDPSGLGTDRHRRYALPRVSPSGTLVSFYVVDSAKGRVTLWVDGVGREPSVVTDWSLPAERVVEPPLLASWVSDDTALFVQPDAWQDGMPTEAKLHRLTVGDGDNVVELLT